MIRENDRIPDEGLSFRDLYLRVVALFNHLWSLRFRIILLTSVLFLLYAGYSLIRRPIYSAETTFVLETGGPDLGGGLGSLASLAGFDISGIAGGSPLFQNENIIELYRSREMLRETFLTPCVFDGGNQLLIDRYADFTKLRKKWNSNEETSQIRFDIPREEFTVTHDSLLFEVIKVFRERHLVVEKPSRQLSILSVLVSHKDQLFAKCFNETLVRHVNAFYLATKTKKTAENLRILQYQTDSVKGVIDKQLTAWSQSLEGQPNINPVLKTPFIESRKLEIDLKTSAAAYEQLVTSLEMAKITHRNNTPLIQIIDRPVLPLPNNKLKLFKLLVLSAIVSLSLSVAFFTGKYIFENAIKS